MKEKTGFGIRKKRFRLHRPGCFFFGSGGLFGAGGRFLGRRLFAGDRFFRLPDAMGRKKQKMCGLAGCPAEKTGKFPLS